MCVCACVQVKVPITIIFVSNCIPSNELLLYIEFIQESLASTVVSNEEISFHVNHRARYEGDTRTVYRFFHNFNEVNIFPLLPSSTLNTFFSLRLFSVSIAVLGTTQFIYYLSSWVYSVFFFGVTLPLFVSTICFTAISHCHDAKSYERKIMLISVTPTWIYITYDFL